MFWDNKCKHCGDHGHKITHEARLQQLKDWLNECLDSHPQCEWPRTSPPLPTRVLQLSLDDGSEDVRLVEGYGRRGHYAALTYCWGPAPDDIFKTTSANLSKNQSRIHFSDLNLLFRESITVLRSLAIPYLWIDALCIIQDSAADWHREASTMAVVYSNAHLTLSASVSPSPNTALLPTFVLVHDDRYRRGPTYMHGDVRGGTLARRGWCLQERCLSRRIVHFGRQQVHWECAGAMYSEHPVTGVTHRGPGPAMPTEARLVLGPLGFLHDDDAALESQDVETQDGALCWSARRDPYWLWYMIMNDYTSRLLTKERDRMPAILGLVSAFEKATGDRMIWGLWRNDLAVGLLWSRVQRSNSPRGVKEAHVPAGRSTPSWSWLRAKGQVKFDLGGDREEVSSRVVSLDEDTNTVVLQAKLLRLRPSLYSCCASARWDFDPEPVDLAMHTRASRCNKEVQLTGGTPREIWVLLMVEPTRDDHGMGLMLVKTVQPTAYQRVGFTMLRPMADFDYKPPIRSMSVRIIKLQ